MPSTTQRYPLSSPDGKPIPLEIIKPHGYIRRGFTDISAVSVGLPAEVEILSLHSSWDCIISFSGDAEIPVDGVLLSQGIFLPKNMRITVAPTSTSLSVIGDSGSGTLHIQAIDKWVGLATQSQLDRR